MDTTERLSLPLLTPGQAQKELFHNEALQLLDSIVAPAVEGEPLNAPPPNPAPGQCYLVGSEPTADWTGFANQLAAYTEAGWRFMVPTAGLAPFVKSTLTLATLGSNGWEIGTIRGSTIVIDGDKVVGPRASPIDDPVGGAVIDAEGRSALASILAALRQHGLISS